MFGPSARFALACSLLSALAACSEDPKTARKNAQPGQACEVTNDCAVGFTCDQDVCRQTVPFRISLNWDVDTDFDLHVVTPPYGREVYFGREDDSAFIARDDCASEECIEPDLTHAEHALLSDPEVPPADVDSGDVDGGEASDAGPQAPTPARYRYWVDNYGCKHAGDFTLTVFAQDESVIESHTGTLAARCVESEHFTVDLVFP